MAPITHLPVSYCCRETALYSPLLMLIFRQAGSGGYFGSGHFTAAEATESDLACCGVFLKGTQQWEVTQVLTLACGGGRHEMEAVRPILIVAPATMLPFWEGETALWVGDDANVIVYAGSLAARNVMHDHELWLSPGSLDGKSATHKTREVRCS